MLWIGLQCVIVVFPGHAHFLSFDLHSAVLKKKSIRLSFRNTVYTTFDKTIRELYGPVHDILVLIARVFTARIHNAWVSTKAQNEISIKISCASIYGYNCVNGTGRSSMCG